MSDRHCHRADRHVGAAGADLTDAGRHAAACRAGDPVCIFRGVLRGDSRAYIVTVDVPGATWLGAASLIPFAWAGGLIGRRVGDRLGVEAATVLALIVLIATGLYTVVAAARLALS